MRAPVKKVTRIFVARIAPSVTEETFRRYIECDIFIKIICSIFFFGNVVSYSHIESPIPLKWKHYFNMFFSLFFFLCSHFEKYGDITDLYMPKVLSSL